MNQNTFAFTNEQFQAFIREIVTDVPRILAETPVTAEFGHRITSLQILESLKSPLTVAVMGQMKAGKSTLLNALVGQDLAPTGVKETTATVNHFVYGSGAECDKFRIHWKDDAVDPADEPIKSSDNWIGEMSDIEKVKYLEFRADAAFLKDYHLMDTPGTRSVVDAHEAVVRNLLSEKQREDETLEHGHSPRAVLYVLNPNAKREDTELLQFFGDETRLPGATPYNSIAVIQKWDTLHFTGGGELKRLRDLAEREEAAWARFLPEKPDPDELKPDPLAIVQLRRAALKAALAGEVVHVIPVSGLLANQLRDVPDGVWSVLAKLGAESPGKGLGTLLAKSDYFAYDVPGVSLDTVERKQLLDAVPWHILRFSVRLAYARKIGDGAELRCTVEEASGIETLKKALESRFMESQSLIKALAALRKLRLCVESAGILLDNHVKPLELGEQAVDILRQPQYNTVSALRTVREYVEASLSSTGTWIEKCRSARSRLAKYRETATIHADQLQDDRDFKEKLAEVGGDVVIPDCVREAGYVLFGREGGEVWKRLGLESEEEMHRQGPEVAIEQLDFWQTHSVDAYGDFRDICLHAIERLNEILDYLETATP